MVHCSADAHITVWIQLKHGKSFFFWLVNPEHNMAPVSGGWFFSISSINSIDSGNDFFRLSLHRGGFFLWLESEKAYQERTKTAINKKSTHSIMP
jgi:hypothetical protein